VPPEDPDDEDPDEEDPDDWDPDEEDPDDEEPELDDDAVDEVAGVELVEESDDEVLPSLVPFVLVDAAAGISDLGSERESVR
jgi:hypothetical protein